jgi:hypothetical protein
MSSRFNMLGSEQLGLTAGAAITKNRFVKLSAAETVINTAAATDIPLGVATEAPANTFPCPIQIIGVAKVEAGAAVAAGAQVSSDASGRGITAAASSVSAGIAITAATAAGEIFAVLLHCGPNVNGPVN